MNSPVLDRVSAVEAELGRLNAAAAELEQQTPPPETDEKALSERYEKIASIKASQMKNEEEYAKLREQMATIELTLEDLARVIEIWTGIPSGSITANEFERLAGLADRLKKRIVGQDAAVDAVCRAIKRSRPV